MNKISAKYVGLISGALMVMVSLVLYYKFQLPDTASVRYYICFSIYSSGIIISLLNFSQRQPAQKKFTDYFSEGFKTFVVVVLIMAVYTWVFYKMNPQIFDNIINQINKINALDANKTPQEVIDNGEKIRSIKIPMTVALHTIMYMLLGAVVTLITTLCIRFKKSN